ncbi:copper ABC transporter permease [Roseburia sp. AM51-8]|uniref:Gldg family protein n=1 Tax=Roseburia sp. AM51-8 TaxID=2292366 RepID=UPI000E54D366|nr:Gldg family protein [Roseburia sp. AM51-8]RHQ02549.1 copper ABC transporter permease [Roseburia sp. AM51-8]
MLAIFKREFKSLFWNITGWLFIGITLALFGLYFFVYNLSYGYPYISYSLSAIAFLFMVTVPILTMRVLAEEKHAKTDQLLLTAPISVGKIVLGKFLALALVYTICIGVICVSPLVLMIFGDVPLAETYVGILGFWLYGLATIAIGTFVSSLTESQVISAVVSFGLIFVGYMMSSICSVISSSGNLLTKILGCYDLYTPLDDFFNGTLSVTGIVYYLSVIALALFLTEQMIQKRRWTISRNMISTSVFSTGMIAIVVALTVVVNLIASALPETYTQIDATSQKLYSITEDTEKYLDTLKDDVTLYVMVNKNSKDDNVDRTLQKYASASKHVKVKYVDPNVSPTFASKYTDSDVTSNSIIVVCGDRSKVIDYNSDIYEYSYDSSYNYSVTGYDCEGQVTAAIQYVTSESTTNVYELTGHDESTLSGDFSEVFQKRFMNVGSLSLLTVDAIPEDCQAIFITAPQSDLSEDDLSKLSQYLGNGGKIYLSIDYSKWNDLTNFKKLLSDNNIETTESLLAETDRSYYYQSPFYLLPNVENTEVSSSVAGMTQVFVPYSVGLTYTGEDDSNVTSFMTTSDTTIAKAAANIAAVQSQADAANIASVQDGDTQGQYSLGMMVTNENGGELCVLGSAMMCTDSANQIVSGHNATLFNGIVNALVTTDDENSDNAVVIAAKDYTVSNLTVSANAMLVYGILWGIFMPIVLIIIGIIVWARRRKR